MADETPANSIETGPKKRGRPPKGRPFQPGQSGNPNGRPKIPEEVRDFARAHTIEAIERLAFWMRSDEGSVSVRAAEAILDRAWGKPAQAVTGADGGALIPAEVIHKHVTEAAVAVAPVNSGPEFR